LYCGGGGVDDVDSCDGGGDDVHGTRNLHNRKVDYWFLMSHFFMYR